MSMWMTGRFVDLAGVLLLGALLSAPFAGMGRAQTPKKRPQPKGPESTGPEIGEKIPSFRALDQDGKEQTFESLRGPKGLLLLIHRSADW